MFIISGLKGAGAAAHRFRAASLALLTEAFSNGGLFAMNKSIFAIEVIES